MAAKKKAAPKKVTKKTLPITNVIEGLFVRNDFGNLTFTNAKRLIVEDAGETMLLVPDLTAKAYEASLDGFCDVARRMLFGKAGHKFLMQHGNAALKATVTVTIEEAYLPHDPAAKPVKREPFRVTKL